MKTNLENIIGGLIILVVIIVLFPILVIYFPFEIYQSKKLERKFQAFLIEQNDQNYFVYNNRRKTQKFIEENVLPKLTKKENILFLKNKDLQVSENKEFLSLMLHRLENYKRFPHLIKIRNGKIIDVSINQELSAWKYQAKGSKQFFSLLNTFFETKT